MGVRVKSLGHAAVVSAERRLVVGNRQDLKNAVVEELEGGRRAVVIDFGDTDLIDSGGLGALVALYRHAEELGGTLVLANLSEELSALLRLTKLDTIFTVSSTVEEALRRAGAESAERSPAAAPARKTP